jgi:hypothetical protein
MEIPPAAAKSPGPQECPPQTHRHHGNHVVEPENRMSEAAPEIDRFALLGVCKGARRTTTTDAAEMIHADTRKIVVMAVW